MGGRGSGGARVGSGPPPKDARARWLGGNAGKRQGKATVQPPEPVDPPADLPAEQLGVWNELAPHALAGRTLTKGTAAAFRDLCEAIVVKRAMLAKVETDGLTYIKHSVDGAGVEREELKAHPLISQHRGMMQRVEAGMLRFRLSPMGKELTAPEEPEDEWAEFDDADGRVN